MNPRLARIGALQDRNDVGSNEEFVVGAEYKDANWPNRIFIFTGTRTQPHWDCHIVKPDGELYHPTSN